jgi:FG-GAP repeat
VSRRRVLGQPRKTLGLAAAIVGFGVFSSSVGIGALPTTSLPIYGDTTTNASRTTVAVLGDVNGDGLQDYAVGMPYADAGGADSGVVYVFLGRAGALAPTPTALNVATASFTITGHGGELLGFSVTGGDFNGDGRDDIGIGAPMGNGPNRVGAGVVYTVFGTRTPRNVSTTELNYTGYTNDPANPAPHSPIGSRYEGFQPNSHTGTAVAAMPDVNGDGYEDLAIGMPDASLHRPGGGGAAVLYGKPSGEHINLADLWEAGYPYYFHVDFPTLDNQHVGETVASVPDMTGDGSPDLAVGAPQSDLNGKVDSGSVWIINGRLPPATGCRQPTIDATCPWIRLDRLSAVQGYRIDGAAAGDGLGSSIASVGDQNGDGRPDLAIGASASSPFGRSGAGEVVIVQGQSGSATRNLAVSPPLQRIAGATAGAGLGASLAAAGDMDGDGRIDLLAGAPGDSNRTGAAYLLRGAPNTSTDLALVPFKIAAGGGNAQFGSAVAAGRALDGAGADGLIAGPGAGGAFIVSGAGLLNPTTPTTATPPASPSPPAAPVTPPPVTTPAKPADKPVDNHPTVKKKKTKKLPLCPRKKPKAKYKIVKGKRVKVKPAKCRPRPHAKTRAKTKAKIKAKATARSS